MSTASFMVPQDTKSKERTISISIRTYAERNRVDFHELVDLDKLYLDTKPLSVGMKTYKIDNRSNNTIVKVFITRVSPSAKINLPLTENIISKHWSELTAEKLKEFTEEIALTCS